MRTALTNWTCVVALCATVAGEQPKAGTTQKVAQGPRLSLKYDSSSRELSIVLSNDGKEAIRVDKNLAIPLHIEFLDEANKPIDLQEQREPLITALEDAEARFVRLAPGEKLERAIRLDKPIQFFVYGHATSNVGGSRLHRPFGYEAFGTLPATAKPRTVVVTYGLRPLIGSGFKAYAGTTLEALGVFKGPLEGEALVEEKRDGK